MVSSLLIHVRCHIRTLLPFHSIYYLLLLLRLINLSLAMGRSPCCDKNGLKKGPWTPEEDQKLIDYITKYGYGNWRTLPKNAGLQRCGKSCRLRWTNYLRPDIKRGRFSFEEEETIIHLHSILGNKWSAIAARLPGRTDNEIKNYWNTHIRKRLLRMGIDPVTHNPRIDLFDLSSILNSSFYNSSQMNFSKILRAQTLINPELLMLATSLQNPNFYPQNGDETTLQNPQLQDQFQHLVQPGQYQTLMEENPLNFSEDFANEITNFSSPSFQQNEWQIPSNLIEDYTLPPSYNINQNLNFRSDFSPPSSSPAPLNSNSTYEDEKDSYCNNLLKFEIPDTWNVNQFM